MLLLPHGGALLLLPRSAAVELGLTLARSFLAQRRRSLRGRRELHGGGSESPHTRPVALLSGLCAAGRAAPQVQARRAGARAAAAA